MKRSALGILIAVSCINASSSDYDVLREACSSVKDSAKRLACYDALDRTSKSPQKKIPAKKNTRDDLISSAHQSLLMMLNDPDSARFTSEEISPSSGAVCGFVNAKNSMGGYAGAVRYIHNKDSTIIESPRESWKMDSRCYELCSDI